MQDKLENKYYTPDIEDLFMGYECESNVEWQEPIWSSLTINISDRYSRYKDLLDNNRIRTKYLDKQDIEELGWKYEGKSVHYAARDRYEIDETYLEFAPHLPNYSHPHIIIYDSDDIFYHGDCSSKNELKKLMKMLNIK